LDKASKININLLLLAAILFLAACNNEKKNLITDTPFCPLLDIDSTRPDYEIFKGSIKKKKLALNKDSLKTVSNYFFNLLNDDIHYYWKGTPWDFNGTTQKPKEGNIACGYFVTNTLTDLGFKIQRIKLAQAVSSKMITLLCSDVHRFSAFEKLEAYLNKQPINSAYIIGLDFHTGYILRDSAGSYFLHSNFYHPRGVIKEKIEKSTALLTSKSFMIGSLTSNKKLLEKWMRE
jgi:hypothetical protein